MSEAEIKQTISDLETLCSMLKGGWGYDDRLPILDKVIARLQEAQRECFRADMKAIENRQQQRYAEVMRGFGYGL